MTETTTDMTDDEIARVREAIPKAVEAASAKVTDMCSGSRRWVMSIPARPDYDHDLVIGDALRVLSEAVFSIDTLRRQRDDYRQECLIWIKKHQEMQKERDEALTEAAACRTAYAGLEAQLHEALKGWERDAQYRTAVPVCDCPRCRREAAEKEAGE